METTSTEAHHSTHDGHAHDHAEGAHHHHEAQTVRSQPVVLDLGDGIGALIVYTGPELLGEEIEISPAGDDGKRQHKQVLQRTVGARAVNVLVYDNLSEGEYTLWRDETPTRGVRVQGGVVAELDWARTRG
jgi:hypothetical protein